jgi:hypothetical protein
VRVRDPSTEKQAEKAKARAAAATTFEGVALEWMESQSEKWSESFKEKVRAILANNLFPRIGSVPIHEITSSLLLAAIKPVETRGALEVAGRAREYSSRVFRYAIATGRGENDPAAALKGAFKVRQSKGHPHLERNEVGPFLRALEEYPGKVETRLAVKLLLLMFVRTGELRSAQCVVLQRLKALGVQLAIDDFGTGYSSMWYLKKLPIDVLKIDRAFVNGLQQNGQDSAIVRSIVDLAQALKLQVTAEGIETRTQADELKDMKCNYGQGYHYSKPLPNAAIAKLLARAGGKTDDQSARQRIAAA